MRVSNAGVSARIIAELSFVIDQHVGIYELKNDKYHKERFNILNIEDKKVRPEQVHGHYRKFEKRKHR